MSNTKGSSKIENGKNESLRRGNKIEISINNFSLSPLSLTLGADLGARGKGGGEGEGKGEEKRKKKYLLYINRKNVFLRNNRHCFFS